MEEAGNKDKIWKVVKDITNPKEEKKWRLKNGEEISIVDIAIIITNIVIVLVLSVFIIKVVSA